MNDLDNPGLATRPASPILAQPAPRPASRAPWTGLLALALCLAAAATAWQFGLLTPRPAEKAEPLAPGLTRQGALVTVPDASPYRARIAVAPVEPQQVQRSRAEPGFVEADPSRTFNILPPLGGRLTDLKVHLGDHVVQGQPLAAIDSGDLAQAYADADKARASIALTRRALERARGLNQIGGGATKDVESATNDAQQAEAEFNRTQARLKAIGAAATSNGSRLLTVASPAIGTVTAIAAAPGAYINDATQSLMTVSDLSQVWVTANVPEKDIGFVERGQAVTVTFVAYPGESFPGQVLFVNDLMEPDTRRTKVRIGFPNPDGRLKPNMFATVTFIAPPRDVLTVPDSALLMNNDSTTVFVERQPWTFARQTVTTGFDQDGRTAITAGLKPGDRIVTRGGVLLND